MINLIEYRIMDRLYVMMKEYVQDKNYLYIFYLHDGISQLDSSLQNVLYVENTWNKK